MSDFDESLWKKVEEYRELINTKVSDYPIIEDLECSYLDGHRDVIADGTLDRTERIGSNPLVAAMYYVEVGFYPPPEIMLAINKCWIDYLESGDMELAFFGPKKQRSGSFAKRSKKEMRDFWIHKQAEYLVGREGMTLAQAAEAIHIGMTTEPKSLMDVLDHLETDDAPDADTIERMLHGKFIWNKERGK